MPKGKQTIYLGSVTLTSSYQTIEADPSLYGSIGSGGMNQVILHFVASSLSSVVFTPEEQYNYTTSGTEEIGYSPLTRDDGSSNIVPLELTLNGGKSYAWNTLADRIRVKVKSASNTNLIKVYLTFGQSV